MLYKSAEGGYILFFGIQSHSHCFRNRETASLSHEEKQFIADVKMFEEDCVSGSSALACSFFVPAHFLYCRSIYDYILSN